MKGHDTMRHHIIALYIRGGRGYRKRLASYATRDEALDHILKRSPPWFTTVYRDGTTGKRYSYNEARTLRHQQEQPT